MYSTSPRPHLLYPLGLLLGLLSVLAVSAPALAVGPAPILVYHEEQTDGSLILYRKVGDREPERLVVLTDVPHAPNYRLSYSKKLLAMNLASSIQILDLQTKKLKTLLTTDGTFDSLSPPTAGVAITTNDKYVLAIERTLGPNEPPPGREPDDEVTAESAVTTPVKYTYRVHYVNIKTGKDRILRRAAVKDVMVPRFFRPDGLALLLTPSGQLTLFDVKKKKFVCFPATVSPCQCRVSSYPRSVAPDPRSTGSWTTGPVGATASSRRSGARSG